MQGSINNQPRTNEASRVQRHNKLLSDWPNTVPIFAASISNKNIFLDYEEVETGMFKTATGLNQKAGE